MRFNCAITSSSCARLNVQLIMIINVFRVKWIFDLFMYSTGLFSEWKKKNKNIPPYQQYSTLNIASMLSLWLRAGINVRCAQPNAYTTAQWFSNIFIEFKVRFCASYARAAPHFITLRERLVCFPVDFVHVAHNIYIGCLINKFIVHLYNVMFRIEIDLFKMHFICTIDRFVYYFELLLFYWI